MASHDSPSSASSPRPLSVPHPFWAGAPSKVSPRLETPDHPDLCSSLTPLLLPLQLPGMPHDQNQKWKVLPSFCVLIFSQASPYWQRKIVYSHLAWQPAVRRGEGGADASGCAHLSCFPPVEAMHKEQHVKHEQRTK